jgi:DNA-directed RNA polymerase subunit M/transcription elongation factor TFIIS
MACPECGCKLCYEYDDDGELDRCAACGNIFDVNEHADEDED